MNTTTIAGALLTAALFVTAGQACSNDAPGGQCPPGELIGLDGECHTVCNRVTDCGSCQGCVQGLCYDLNACLGDNRGGDSAGGDPAGGDWLGGDTTGGDWLGGDTTGGDSFDPCTACDPGTQVCYLGGCRQACGAGGQCGPGLVCVEALDVRFCTDLSTLQLSGGTLGQQTSQSGSFRLRGGPRPVTGSAASASFRLVPAGH